MTALAAAGCLWGTGFLFAKIAFREMGVVANVSLRFLFGSVVLAPMFFRKTRKFRRSDFWLMVLNSLPSNNWPIIRDPTWYFVISLRVRFYATISKIYQRQITIGRESL